MTPAKTPAGGDKEFTIYDIDEHKITVPQLLNASCKGDILYIDLSDISAGVSFLKDGVSVNLDDNRAAGVLTLTIR